MSMMPILEACRKRKRRPKIFGLQTFAEQGNPISPNGPFRDNIRLFLRQCAEAEEYDLEGMPIWCTLFRHETKSFVAPLYTIEEDVKYSPQPYCDHCRYSGWSNHYLSKRKYHLIIPNDRNWHKPLDIGIFDVQSHLLHGLIHCNGFGHLLCINGIEGGSNFLYGREIMDLWDRICTNLRVRKITVEDVSKKNSMDLRLLHGVAYGHPWFGKWGYKFCHGSFGVTEHHYDRAIECLSSLELDKIVRDFGNIDQSGEIKKIIHIYRSMSETRLTTLRDIFRFMLTIKSRPVQPIIFKASSAYTIKHLKGIPYLKTRTPKEKFVKYKKFSIVAANMDSRWSARRLESAAEVIVDALKEKKEGDKFNRGWMTRQEVRDAARLHIGDTGLLDYVLKSMNNVVVGQYIVQRSVHPVTRLLEYSIHEIGDENEGIEPVKVEKEIFADPSKETACDVYGEVVYLYVNVLMNYPGSEMVELATQAILDCKQFVKEWPLRDDSDEELRFICQVMPSFVDIKGVLTDGKFSPGELVTVPLHCTLLELKRAAEIALRDTYCIMENLVVTDIEKLEGMYDGDLLFGAVESGQEIWLRGLGMISDYKWRYEGGDENWRVRCECGARDDDGERMVACDICGVWQHTRCHGINDSDNVPPLFVCRECCGSLAPPQRNDESSSFVDFENSDELLLMSVSEPRLGGTFGLNGDTGMGMFLSSSVWE